VTTPVTKIVEAVPDGWVSKLVATIPLLVSEEPTSVLQSSSDR
jgi:hypothetical protein